MAEIENEIDDTKERDEVTEDANGEWTPPAKQDWDNLQLALKKARQDARAAKRDAKKEPAEGEKPENIERAATEKAEARFKPILVRQAARAAFVEAGLLVPKGKTEGVMARVMKLLDHDDLDVDDNGDVTGLDEQITEIKAEFPEMFVRKGGQRVDGADRGDFVSDKKASADRLAAILTGSR